MPTKIRFGKRAFNSADHVDLARHRRRAGLRAAGNRPKAGRLRAAGYADCSRGCPPKIHQADAQVSNNLRNWIGSAKSY